MVVDSVNLILGLPVNGFVLWLILTASRESIASEVFSLNLALSELLFSFSGVCSFIYLEVKSFLVSRVFMFSFGLLLTARPLFQCCICMESYTGVVHLVLYLRLKPFRYRLSCCSVMWLIILLSCTYNLCTFSDTLYLYVYFIQSALLFCVMLFCSLSVLRALKRPGPGDKDRGRKKSSRMKRKAFRIILLIMIFMTMNFFLFMAAIPLQCCLDPEKRRSDCVRSSCLTDSFSFCTLSF